MTTKLTDEDYKAAYKMWQGRFETRIPWEKLTTQHRRSLAKAVRDTEELLEQIAEFHERN